MNLELLVQSIEDIQMAERQSAQKDCEVAATIKKMIKIRSLALNVKITYLMSLNAESLVIIICKIQQFICQIGPDPLG